MSTMIRRYKQSLLAIGVLSMLFTPRLVAAQCVGDCTSKGSTTAGDVGKITDIILKCPGGACGENPGGNASGCAASPNGCAAADYNAPFGCLTAGELGKIKDYVLHIIPCPPFPTSTPGGVTPTPTNTPTPPPTVTNTPTPPPTNTPSPTSTPTKTPTPTSPPTATNTPTPSATPTQQITAACGDGIVQTGEDCDEGGTCIGGYNAGTHCTSDSQCVGQGVCPAGGNTFQACDTDADCPLSKCVHCRVFGGVAASNSPGKTCAANCTFESNVDFTLIPGIVTGTAGDYGVIPGTSTSYVHPSTFLADGLPPLAMAGFQTIAGGKLRDGVVPVRIGHGQSLIKGPTPGVNAMAVGTLSCACVRGVEDMTCGGVLTEKDGTPANDCTTGWVMGTCSGDQTITCYDNDPGGIKSCIGGTNDGSRCSIDSDCPGGACIGNGCFEPIPPTPGVGAKTKTPTVGPTWTPQPAGTCVVPDPCATQASKANATPKPCTYVHGAGNEATGFVGCNGLDGDNQYYSQDQGNVPEPAPPTPPEGSGPAIVKLRNACACSSESQCGSGQTCDSVGRCTCTSISDCHAGETCVCPEGNLYSPLYPQGTPLPCATPTPGGSGAGVGECIFYTGCLENLDCPGTLLCQSGPAGSIVIVSSTAIGLVPAGNTACSVPTKTPLAGPKTNYGLDRRWCTDDDPQRSRGTVQTLPIVSGFSSGVVTNMYNVDHPGGAPSMLGPYTVIGKALDCSAMLAPTPSVCGMGVGGAFTALNQANLDNTDTTNIQWAQCPSPTPSPTPE